jgi:NAD(P)-dependent dehydrogenase (short-subunit alcohol dehydrogenase family)
MRVIVTGGNSGVGKATAAALAADGHQVTIACRDVEKGRRAAAEMTGDVAVSALDLADLASVRAFADTVEAVDVLINNAGVMAVPLTRTVDGFEFHIGINHLGHFALTCLLADRITARVISVASATYLFSRLHLDDLNWEHRRYSRSAAYGESKLANMLFVAGLTTRGMRAYATDPGATDTDITRSLNVGEHRWIRRHVLHSPAQGARASVQAVTTDLPGGTYLAPRFNQFGRPKPTRLLGKATDPVTAELLWEVSAQLTGCDWPS